MVNCCATGCKSTHKNSSGLSFHRFPRDTHVKNQWIKAMGRKNWSPTEHTKLCGKHFTEDDYEFGHVRRLRDTAVPSRFFVVIRKLVSNRHPKLLKSDKDSSSEVKVKKKKKSHIKMEIETLTQVKEEDILEEDNNDGHLVFLRDPPANLKAENSKKVSRKKSSPPPESPPDSPESMQDDGPAKTGYSQNNHIRCKIRIQSLKLKIKTLQQKNRRQAKKNADLNTINEELERIVKNLGDGNEKLFASMCDPNKDFLMRLVAKSQNRPQPRKYSPELWDFAKTLYRHSHAAYAFVRQVFDTCLPHEKTIMKKNTNLVNHNQASVQDSNPDSPTHESASEVSTHTTAPTMSQNSVSPMSTHNNIPSMSSQMSSQNSITSMSTQNSISHSHKSLHSMSPHQPVPNMSTHKIPAMSSTHLLLPTMHPQFNHSMAPKPHHDMPHPGSVRMITPQGPVHLMPAQKSALSMSLHGPVHTMPTQESSWGYDLSNSINR